MIRHYDHNLNFIQTIPEFTGKQGGYNKLNCIEDVMGGHLGGDFVLPPYPRQQAMRIKRGHFLVPASQGRSVYAAQVTARENQGDQFFIQMDGVVNLWSQRTPGNISWGAGRSSDAMKALVGLYGPGYLLSTDLSRIKAPTPYTCAAYTFAKQKIADIINHYNAFEGYEWGGGILSGPDKPAHFYYRVPDYLTLHYVIDSRSLDEPLQLKPDTTKFGNKVRVYYDAATGGAGFSDVTGTAAATADGVLWAPDIDISSGVGSTAAEATKVGQQLLNSFKVNGIETEPMNAQIVIDDSTRIRSVSGAQTYPFWLQAGCNVFIEGATDPNSVIGSASAGTYLHITRVERKFAERQVSLTVNKVDGLPQMLARLNAA